MRLHLGGEWISFLGIPPFTILFILLMFLTIILHRLEVARGRRRARDKADETWIRSWF